jgi:8-oxo-dGTP pyrophosphatase MutT (NUDIX family)
MAGPAPSSVKNDKVFDAVPLWTEVEEPGAWHTTTTRESFRNPWLHLTEHDVTIPDGRSIYYGVVRCSKCVGMLPFIDDDTVLLVRQWRYIIGRATWEMPTGGCHSDETFEQAAQREMAEEVKATAGTLISLGSFNTSKSVVDEEAHLFICRDLQSASLQEDDTEFLGIAKVPFDQLLTWVLDGEVVDAMTIIAVLRADRLRRG